MEAKYLRQRVVLWPYVGRSPNGEVILGAPRVLEPARWEESSQDAQSADTSNRTYDAEAWVTEPVDMYSVMGEGDEPEDVTTHFQVMRVKITKDIKARHVNIHLSLNRYKYVTIAGS